MPNIVVVGDLVVDHHLIEDPSQPSSFAEAVATAVAHRTPGGAWYLLNVLQWLTSDLEDVRIAAPKPHDVNRLSPADLGGLRIAHAYQSWTPVLREPDSKEGDQVWRVRHFVGCQKPPKDGVTIGIEPEDTTADILVIDDLGLGFADDSNLIAKVLERCDKDTEILWKTSGAMTRRGLWTELRSFRNRLTVVVPAEALRTRGAEISTNLSWDRTIEDTVAELTSGPSQFDLALCKRVIVTFDVAGAAVFSRVQTSFAPATPNSIRTLRLGEGPATLERFVYRPDELPGDWRAKHQGRIFGATSFVAAAVARHILTPEEYPLFVALERALETTRTAFTLGAGKYEPGRRDLPVLTSLGGNPGTADKPSEPATKQDAKPSCECAPKPILQAIQDALRPPKAKNRAPKSSYASAFRHQILATDALSGQPPSESNLLRDLTGFGPHYAAARALDIIISGPDDTLRAAPRAKYGKYFTVDRDEIQRLNAVRALIEAYQANRNDDKPLAIAVFGPPGAGKSFAIKQLASLYTKKDPLEFNLSELRESDLNEAFHQVRDRSLRGEIPFVFWDEFDSGNLEWLRRFLAPIQDSQFFVNGFVHPLGRSVFIFAGGTASTFNEFQKRAAEAKALKAPDFVSRLRGFIDIKGPNPTGWVEANAQTNTLWEEFTAADPAFLIRRALLIRSTLKRFYPNLFTREMASVSAAVLHALLHVRELKHGARSLESLIKMSNVRDARHFSTSMLPPKELLAMHASDDFIDLVKAGEVDGPLIDALARTTHAAWSAQKKSEGYDYGPVRNDDRDRPLTHPDLVEYDQLSEPSRESNRSTARTIVPKLLELGLRIQRGAAPSNPTLSSSETETLLRIEHDIWLRDHLLNGYEWSAETKEHLRLHKDVAPFDSLAESETAYDRAIVNGMLTTLGELGYTLVPAC